MGRTDSLEKTLMLGKIAGGEGDDRGWDGCMASLMQWTWVWVGVRSWWWTVKPGVLHSTESQRVGHNWVTELNWTECRRCWFHPWVRKILWRREWLPTAVYLPGKSHGQGSLVGYSPWGCKESDTTEHAQDTQLVRGHIYIWTPILIFQTLSYFFYTPLPEENKNQYRACVSSTYQGKIQDVSKHLASGRKNNR